MKTYPWNRPVLYQEESEKFVVDALRSTWISGGGYIDQLENYFTKQFKMNYAVSVSNGTTAIHLAFLSVGLQPGDEVIIPGFAFLAAANVAIQMGAIPVFAEVEPKTWCITAETIASKITDKTKIVVVVHTYGNVCAMHEIMDIVRTKKIVVIEDCAESIFSQYKGSYAGTFGDISCFSFQATKTITTGEGGIVLTNNDKYYKEMQLYRNHGLKIRGSYVHEVPGHNFRLTNIQAAIGVAQLMHVDEIKLERNRIHAQYTHNLHEQDGVSLQVFLDDVNPVLWAFAILLEDKVFPLGRDGVMGQLAEKNIETRPGFCASSLLDIYDQHSLPICEKISRQTLSLPTYVALTNDDIAYISQCLLACAR